MNCPRCDEPLMPYVGHPDSAPWVCNLCHLGFWNAELTDGARAAYRPEFHDWGLTNHELRDAVHRERRERQT